MQGLNRQASGEEDGLLWAAKVLEGLKGANGDQRTGVYIARKALEAPIGQMLTCSRRHHRSDQGRAHGDPGRCLGRRLADHHRTHGRQRASSGCSRATYSRRRNGYLMQWKEALLSASLLRICSSKAGPAYDEERCPRSACDVSHGSICSDSFKGSSSSSKVLAFRKLSWR